MSCTSASFLSVGHKGSRRQKWPLHSSSPSAAMHPWALIPSSLWANEYTRFSSLFADVFPRSKLRVQAELGSQIQVKVHQCSWYQRGLLHWELHTLHIWPLRMLILLGQFNVRIKAKIDRLSSLKTALYQSGLISGLDQGIYFYFILFFYLSGL